MHSLSDWTNGSHRPSGDKVVQRLPNDCNTQTMSIIDDYLTTGKRCQMKIEPARREPRWLYLQFGSR